MILWSPRLKFHPAKWVHVGQPHKFGFLLPVKVDSSKYIRIRRLERAQHHLPHGYDVSLSVVLGLQEVVRQETDPLGAFCLFLG